MTRNKTDIEMRLLSAAVGLALIVAIVATAMVITMRVSHGQAAAFYGKDGSYQGSVTTRGNEKTFTNNRGEFSGSSITHGNTTTFYDRSGHYQGSTIQQGTASNPLTGGRR